MSPDTRTTLLRATRWFLIAALTLLVLGLTYTGLSHVIAMLLDVDSVLTLIGIVLITLFYAFIVFIPGMMLYALITKRLQPFATGIGTMAALVSFYFAITLPSKLIPLLTSLLDTLPIPFAALGLPLSVLALILPFWLLFRISRLTNSWLYPKILQPLETRL